MSLRRVVLPLVVLALVAAAAVLGYRAASNRDHPADGSPEPAAASRFSEVRPGVVRDARLGLVWTARGADRELSWLEAARYCRELGAGSLEPAWRLATIEELASLYDESQEQPCGAALCRIDPAFELTSRWQWSATASGNRRTYLDFVLGSRASPLIRPALTRGVLCVRADRAGRE